MGLRVFFFSFHMNDRVSFGNSLIQNICSLYNYSLLSFLGQNTEKNAQFLPLFDHYFRPYTEPGKVSLKYFFHFCPGRRSQGTKKRCFCIFCRNFSFALLAKGVALRICYKGFPPFLRFFCQNFTAKKIFLPNTLISISTSMPVVVPWSSWSE